ncbi:c-type cytochrome domain-containing protein [Kaarinaea lacus]
MKNGYIYASIVMTGILTAISIGLSGCGKEPQREVSFAKDIRPIIDANCIKCHASGGQGFEASGLNMESYESLMRGTKFGPVIKAGDALSSTLMILIDGRADPSINMPHGDNEPLSGEQIKLFEQWINQGAKNN